MVIKKTPLPFQFIFILVVIAGFLGCDDCNQFVNIEAGLSLEPIKPVYKINDTINISAALDTFFY